MTKRFGVLILAGLTLGAIVSNAQTGTLQGKQLFLYDQGTTTMNRVSITTPVDDSLVNNYRLILPRTLGAQGDLLRILYRNADTAQLQFMSGTSLFWGLTGNGGTNPGMNLLGTTDGASLRLGTQGGAGSVTMITNGAPRLTIDGAGAITQGPSAGQVTFTGNVDALTGADVSTLLRSVDNTVLGTTTANTAVVNATASFPNLTAQRPLKLNASNAVVAAAIDLSSANDVTGLLPITNGGTGASTAAGARTNLGAQTQSPELDALSAITGTGFVVRSGPGSYLTQSLSAGSNIAITNTNGVSGSPQISVVPNPTFANLTVSNTLTVNGSLQIPGLTPGLPVQVNGSGQLVSESINLGTADVTGILPVANGGTGVATIPSNGVMYGNGTGAVQTTVGTPGQLLTAGAGGVPTWSSTLPSGTVVPFNQISTGTNTTAAMTVGSGATLAPTGTGTITANQLNGLAANGLVVRTASGTFTNRTITGTSPIVVTNGDGVSGNPTISFNGEVIPSGSTSGSTLRWNGTDWVENTSLLSDGTNTNVTGNLDVDGTATIGNLNGVVKATGGVLSAGAVNLASSEVTGILPVANGGTGVATIPSNGVMYGNGTGAVQTTVGTPGQLLTAGAGGVPTWSSTLPSGTVVPFNQISTGTNTTAAMTVGTGGTLAPTGTGTITANQLSGLAGNGMVVQTATGTFASRTITGTSPIVVTNGDGVSGNPTISFNGEVIPSGSTSGSTLRWNGTDWVENTSLLSDGTHTNVTGNLDVDGTATIGNLNGVVKATGGVLSAGAVNLASSEVTGILPVANGGTGEDLSAMTTGSMLYADAVGSFTTLPIGTNGQILSVTGGVPTWTAAPSTSFSALTSGTNTTATMTVGSGATLAPTGTGTITANQLSGLAGNGMVVQTAPGTFASRTITGTSPIVVTNGDGVSGNPTISFNGEVLPSGSTSGSTLRWNGTDWVENTSLLSDGTNTNVTGNLDVDGTATIGNLNGVVKATGGVLSAGAVNLASSEVTGILPVANGGTGEDLSAMTSGSMLYADAVGSFTTLPIGTNGQILSVTGGVPTWTAAPSTSFSALTSGTNTTATMTVGSGATLAPTGTGTITANQLSGLAGNGMVVQTASGTFASRTITGTSPIVVTNGDGVSGNPTISFNGEVIPSGSTSGSTLRWNGTDWVENTSLLSDGTNTNVTGNLDVDGTATIGNLNGVVKATGGVLSAGAVNLASSEVTGILPVANGGTGVATIPSNGVMYGNGTGTVQTTVGTAGQLLSAGVGGTPTWTSTFPSGITVPFNQVSAGSNTAALTVGTGGTLAPTGTGTITANQLSGLAGNGMVVQTAPGTFASRTITGTSPIVVTNGDGVGGNPTISFNGEVIPSGSTSGSTLRWNGTDWVENTSLLSDGTNTNVTGNLDVDGTATIGNLNGVVKATGGVLSAGSVNLASSEVTGILPVANGGTGEDLSAMTTGSMLYADAVGSFTTLPIGTNGQILSVAGGVPTWTAAPSTSFSALTSGTNTTATMTVGSGATLAPTGTGTITANQLSGLAGNGMVVQTATGTFASRTITGTSPIVVTNGDGVGGNPTISFNGEVIPSGSTSGSTLRWNGTDWVENTSLLSDGTNTNVTGNLDVDGTATIGNLNGVVKATGGVLSAGAVNLASSEVTGILPVANGGTGEDLSAMTSGSMLYADAVGSFTTLPIGTNGQILSVAGGVPTWTAAPSTSFSALTSGTNTTATMTVGSGATLAPTGTGTITANQLSGLAGNGMVVQTATGTFASRTITGTSPIVVTNGDGVSGNPTISFNGEVIPSGSTSGSTLRWNGTDWVENTSLLSDGTNTNVTGNLDVDGTATIGNLNGVVKATGGVLSAGAVNLASSEVTGILPVANGGTGVATIPSNGVMYGNGTGTVQTTVGTAGQLLSAGVGGTPTWTSTFPSGITVPFNQVSAGSNTSALTVGTGGTLAPTGTGTITANQLSGLAGNGMVVQTAPGTFASRTITGTSPIVVTNGDGVSGNPTISFNGEVIPSGSTSGSTLRWNGTDWVENTSLLSDGTNTNVTGNLDVDGTATIGNLNGVVKATGGVLSAGAVNLASSEVTGIVPVANGGTGEDLSAMTTGSMLYADAVGSVTTLPIGTNGQILSVTGGVPTWTAAPSTSFSALTSGTNTTATMTVGSGATLAPTGTGTITANQLSGLAGNGMVVQTAPGTFASRTITGTSPIVVTNGDGVSGNPTISFNGEVLPSGSTIGSALRWNGVDWVENSSLLSDGTHTNVAGNLDVDGTATIGNLNGVVKATGGVLSAGAVNLASSEVTGILPVANGGTGEDLSAMTTGSILYADAVGSFGTLPAGTAGQVLTMAGGLPIWSSTLPSGTSVPFDNVSTGTNTSALTVGTGGTLAPTGTGTITANQLSGLAGNGMVVQTASGTFASRTITGTSPIVVTNGDGVSGNPTISFNGEVIPSGSTSGSTLRWNGTDWVENTSLLSDGTNTNVTGNLDVDGTATIGNLNGVVKATGGVLSAGAVNLASSEVTGILPVANGGTGVATIPSNGVMYGNGTGTVQTTVGTAGQLLSAGVGGTPTWTSTFPSGITVPFNQVSAGSNTAALTVGTGGTLAPTGTGTITANQLSGLAGNGMVVQTATGTFASRTITGTSPIVVTNGDGVSGNPTISFNGEVIPSGSTSGSTLRWNGTDWVENTSLLSDGTNTNVTGNLDVDGTATIGNLNGVVKATGGVLSAGAVNLASSEVTGILPVANGGTGEDLSAMTTGSMLYADAVGSFTTLPIGTNGQILSVTTGAPTWTSTFPSGITVPFNQVSAGSNTSALTVGTGGTLAPTGTGTITANQLSGLAGNGMVVQTAPGTFASRTITGTSPIVVTNGDGVSGNPTISFNGEVIPSGSTSGSTLRWNGTDWVENTSLLSDGTNTNVTGNLDVDGTATIGNLNGVVKATGGVLSAGAVNLASSEVTGILPVANGGTGEDLSAMTAGSMLYADAVGSFTTLPIGTNGQILSVTAGAPTWTSTFPSGITVPFNQVSAGSNTSALTVGTGGTLAPTGTGTITANQLSGLAGNGMVVQTATGTFASRTITGTSPIVVTNGDGVSGNPTISFNGEVIPSGSTSGSTLRWNGTDWVENTSLLSDGTNTNVTGNLDVDGTATIGNLNGVVKATGGVLSAGSVNLASSEVSGILPVANGGTGVATIPSNGVMYGNGTGTVQTTVGTAGQLLSAGVGGTPTWTSTFPSGITVPFNQVSAGSNTSALTVGTGGTLAPTGTGTITANQLSGLAGNGMVVQTATGTFASRTITGTSPIVVTNGDGVSGNPTISFNGEVIPSGSTSGSTLRWNGTDWVENTSLLSDGTNTNVTGNLDVDGTATIGNLNGVVKATGGVLSAGAVNLASSEVTGILPVANGGTGEDLSAMTTGSMLYADAVGSFTTLPAGPNGHVLTMTAGVPGWSAAPSSSFAALTSGTNTTATMTVGSGATLAPAGTGTITANQLSGLAGNGMVVQTASGTFASRTITGTSPIVVTNGDGVGGDPTISFNGEVIPSGSTIGSALRWNGTDWVENTSLLSDGTNTNVTGNLDVDGTATIGNLNGVVKATGGVLSAGAVDLASSEVTGILPVANGGTGEDLSAMTAGSMLYADAVGSFTTLPIGTNGQILSVTAGAPTWTSTFPSGITVPFNQVSAGSNTAALTVGTGGTLAPTGTGTITANQLSGLAGNGMVVQTAPGTFASRTITGTSPIVVTNGDGVSGNPTISFNGELLPVGTTSGSALRWNGSDWVENTSLLSDGTNTNVTGNLDVDGTATIGNLNGVVKATGGVLSAGAVNLASSEVSGILPVANGGTGLATIPSNGVMYGNGTGIVQTTVGTAGQLLTAGVGGTPTWSSTLPSGISVPFNQISSGSNTTATMTVGTGASLAPTGTGQLTANQLNGLASNGIVARTASGTFTNRTITGSTNISVSNGNGVSGNPTISITGTIPVGNGGTGLSTITSNGIMYGNGTSAVQTTVGTAGQLLTAGVGGTPTWSSTLPSGTSVPFNQISTGTNTTATMTVGNGASLLPTGTGTVTANQLSGLSLNGIVARTASGTFASRTITGTSPIVVTNGDGVGANPTISFNGELLPVGTTSGSALRWNGSDWVENTSLLSNGTNTNMTGNLDVDGSLTIGSLTGILKAVGGVVSTIGSINLNSADVSGIVPVANGGTGEDLSAMTTGSMLYADAVGSFTTLAAGSNGQVLTMASGVPTWSAAPSSSFGTLTSGTNTSATMTVGSGASLAPTGTGTVTANQLTGLAGNGMVVQTASGAFTNRTITGTANEVTVTNGDGVSANPTVSLPNALTFTGKTVTGGTFTGSTLSGTTTKEGPLVLTPCSQNVTSSTSGNNIATFSCTYEKVTVTASTNSSAHYVNLPTGTDGQVMYLRITSNNTGGGATGDGKIYVRQPDASTKTNLIFPASTDRTIFAHMIYSSTDSKWVVLSAVINP